ncbi:MAG: tetratricopeptide repeat protein [Actinomycetota bacterium]|jgi:putative thioredoxin|nr:tetratricopeptide repeat protein [Actinomycetota bacterium]
MTTPQFSRPGAVDLSAFRPSKTGPPAGAGSFVVEVTGEESLGVDVVDRSMSVVVLLSVWAPDVPESVQINETLTTLAEEFGGRFVLATLDARANAALVSAIGIPSVPLVAAALRGQLAPLFQEPLPESEMRSVIQQILQAAAANGVTGTAETVAKPVEHGGTEEPTAKFPAAEEALLRGDLDAAITQYEAALTNVPGDPEATEGLARARLLKRTSGVDLAAARAAAAEAPDDIEAQITVADLDLLGDQVDDAFTRLLDLVRRTSEADRDAARRHLLELFAVVGDADPRVGKARRALTAALF